MNNVRFITKAMRAVVPAFLVALVLSGCVANVTPGPGGNVWVPGHTNRYGVWVPGHFMPRANGAGYGPGSVWVRGHYNRFGGWVPGHWS